ncbi:hypothetical protein WL30_03390 [Burkholderia ubonensis]|nr:hypothetical protein WL30_03390 [Burkholderia ubonensis]KWB28696.1 hypothetical protein WL31_29690 [Burkholderia ubonensis]
MIPFHWGYRPVDHETYRQDQQRYLAQLNAGNHNPDLPYSTYYLAQNKSTQQNGDNLGNWLNEAYAKDGGTYPNATTNLVDMWGPGPSGGIYGVGKAAQSDPAAPMHENPHRIYYVHAARRLADLILRIRRHPQAGPDTINIIAHSQGTEISMLANFMVVDSGQRPVDCLIMCDTPYGLYPTEAELGMPGKHQSEDARRATLANLTKLMRDHARPVSKEQVTAKGVASRAAWTNPDYARDNFGHVYNYFCPQDTVVALPNIQGMGWQGVDDAMLQAAGSNFSQRVFSDGHVVGTGPETFVLGKGSELAGKLTLLVNGKKRTINGPKLPETYTFHTLKNGPDTGDRLGQHLAGTRLAQEGVQKIMALVDPTSGKEEVLGLDQNAVGYFPQNTAAVNQTLHAVGYPYQVLKAWGTPPLSSDNRWLIQRYETPAEALARLGQIPADWSQHSAITLNTDTIAKCMAYDLAIGLTVAFDDEKLWWELIHQADWRSSKNSDVDARSYYTHGILPQSIKLQMNKPNLPKGVENKFAWAGVYKAEKATTPFGLVDDVVDWISGPPSGGTGQWPLPKPDVRG